MYLVQHCVVSSIPMIGILLFHYLKIPTCNGELAVDSSNFKT